MSVVRSVRAPLLIHAAALGGCVFSSVPPGDEVIGGSLRAEGRIVDLANGQPIVGTGTIAISGLAAEPGIEIHGTGFVLDQIPENSVFSVQAAVPPTHHATSTVIAMTEEDLTGVVIPAIAEARLAQIATSFGVTPSPAGGVLFAQVVNEADLPRAGITAASFVVDGGATARGPFFLDANLGPAPGETMTSASGWVVYFDLSPGIVSMRAAPTANVTLDMPASPATAGVVTVAKVRTIDGKFIPPKNVSFGQQVMPIFKRRGCDACHAAGNAPGRQQGDLTLNDDPALVYRELVMEDPTRVVVGMPELSLVLTMPSREEPPDRHPNVTWTGTFDPDYQLIRVWIAEGAKQN
jgi:hypothetical protein